MGELTRLLADAGWQDVVTYKNSGNVVGRAPDGWDAARLHDLVAQELALDVPVLVWHAADLLAVVSRHPFADQAADRRHVTFLERVPDGERIEAFARVVEEGSEARVDGRVVHLLLSGRYSDSTLSNAALERHLGVVATTRNWNTLAALAALVVTP